MEDREGEDRAAEDREAKAIVFADVEGERKIHYRKFTQNQTI